MPVGANVLSNFRSLFESGFFYYFSTTNPLKSFTFQKPQKSLNFGRKWQNFGHYNFAIFSTMIYNSGSKNGVQFGH